MHFQRPRTLAKNQWRRTRTERGLRNRREQKDLVEQGRAHGILVYAKGQAVGWCQYGSREELQRIDNKRHYRALPLEDSTKKLWRITCFVKDKKHRRRGVAIAALKAALESIRERAGAAPVEAYPIIPWEKLCRSRIRRCGHAPAFGNQSTHGTLSMFEKQGFHVVGPYGLTNLVVRKIVVTGEAQARPARTRVTSTAL